VGLTNKKERIMIKKHNLVFLGPPGVGKGTIAEIIAADNNIVHISTGEIFRHEIKQGSELGEQAREYVASGGLVPDAIVAKLVRARLADHDADAGFIFDGFPRNIHQAEIFNDVLKEVNRKLDLVVSFEASEELLIQRLTARLTCKKCGTNFNKIFSPSKKEGICDKCGGELYQRVDDSLETALDRMKIYNKETAPLVDYYKEKGMLVSINGEQSREITVPEVLKVIS
jgi:adenylate kinase